MSSVLGDSFWQGLALGPESPQRRPNRASFSGFPLEGQWKSSLQYISEMNRLSSEKASVSKAGSAPAADVLVDLEAVRELSSGVSRYRDFIRHLPAHLSKSILSMRGLLGDFSRPRPPRPPPSQRSWEVPRSTSCFPGMLDKNSLNRCVFVSQHWAVLVQQVRTDMSMHSFIQRQITFLQVLPLGGDSCRPALCLHQPFRLR